MILLCICQMNIKIDVIKTFYNKNFILSLYYLFVVDRSMRYQLGQGTCVLFILDFSESMRGSGIQSLRKGVSDILDGIPFKFLIRMFIEFYTLYYQIVLSILINKFSHS